MSDFFDLNPLDRHFASFIAGMDRGGPAVVPLLASLVSNAVGGNHICVDLADLAGRSIRVDEAEQTLPPLETLRHELARSRVVGGPGEYRPLILDSGDRFYLYRYWRYEQDVAEFVQSRTTELCSVDQGVLRDGLSRLFRGSEGECDGQMLAAIAAVSRKFCVVSGGPGTGKTSTVVKILALLLEQSLGSPLRIALAAPTGKAAARLKDSISAMKEALQCMEEVKAAIPEEVSTVHRLLGVTGDGRFRFSAENPLPHDVVIVDEASMVALPMMARVMGALKKGSRLILLGDKDQLASVEAGAVLGDICGREEGRYVSGAFRDLVMGATADAVPDQLVKAGVPPLADSIVVLTKNYRFGAESGIGALGSAINAGEAEGAIGILEENRYPDVGRHDLPPSDMLKKRITETVVQGFRGYLEAGSPQEALERFDSFRVLCAVRQGVYGVAGMNSLVEEIVAEAGCISPSGVWYHGRPVMVTVNDYNLKLFNGDIGIVFIPPGEVAPRVFFPAPGGGVRSFSPARLPAHETVYAMTIHKSQGSEFDQLLLLLPPADSGILTRELLYTGITRARRSVEIWSNRDIIVSSVSRRTHRLSGLGDLLWPLQIS